VAWGSVRGLTYAGGRIVYGGTDGQLRSVPLNPAGIDGSAATVLASSSWGNATLFFAAS
jgi:hypothetical protein